MALDYHVWGPRLWFTLQTMAGMYPESPNEVTRKKYYEFIHNIPVFFPAEPLGNSFGEMLEKYPVTPYLDSRTAFNKWIHFIHNKVLEKEGKLPVPMEEFISNFENAFLPKEIVVKQNSKLKHQLAVGVVLFAVVGVSIVLYRR
jgi:hypothetical protein